jgi:hypothetical protein
MKKNMILEAWEQNFRHRKEEKCKTDNTPCSEMFPQKLDIAVTRIIAVIIHTNI